MNSDRNQLFWEAMAILLEAHPICIDRPKGKWHPDWPEMIYPLDYGYLEGTHAADGGGIDVWLGSLGPGALTGIICTFDTLKSDTEVKLLLGCTSKDVEAILAFYDDSMKILYVPNPKGSHERHTRIPQRLAKG